jgi:uncharacterized protein
MKLENNFTIDAPVEKAWEALNSPETVAPCFPGATLTNYEDDSFTGTVKVKLGPISMTYKGKGTYVSRDESAHEVVIDASGRDSRGNGTASAKVTASLAADGPDKTAVAMVTDMTITGKPAQFGRGVISDVADKIIGQFSACVARKLAAGEESAASSSSASSSASASDEAVVPVSAAAAQATGGVPAPTVAAAKSPGTSESEAPSSSTLDPAGSADVASAATNGAGPGSTPGTSEAEAPASSTLAPDSATPAATETVTPAAPPRAAAAPRGPVRSEVDAIDLLDTAGAPVLKRLAPVAGGAVLLLLVVLLIKRLRSA